MIARTKVFASIGAIATELLGDSSLAMRREVEAIERPMAERRGDAAAGDRRGDPGLER